MKSMPSLFAAGDPNTIQCDGDVDTPASFPRITHRDLWSS